MKIDKIAEYCKKHLVNYNVKNVSLKSYIRDIIDEIATETLLFKKEYKFILDKNIDTYNMYYLAKNIEQELKSDILNLYNSSDVSKKQNIIALNEFDSEESFLESMTNVNKQISFLYACIDNNISLEYKNSSKFDIVVDENFLSMCDGSKVSFYNAVSPIIEEITDDEFETIKPVLIAGLKFYISDSISGHEGAGAVNYNYMRYHNAKKLVIDNIPYYISPCKRKTQI